MLKSAKTTTTQQVLFVPVYGLQVTSSVRRQLRVGRVIFVDAENIPRVRKRLGMKNPVAYYRSRMRTFGDHLFRQAPAYACLKTRRDPNSKDYSSELKVIREAFWLLASSFFSIAWREDAAISLRPQSVPGTIEDVSIFDRSADNFMVDLRRRPPFESNSIDREWKRLTRHYHFFDLMRIVDNATRVQPEWRQALIRASVLAGQSFLARHIAEAFLDDMVAIETLLVEQGEKFPDTLIERLIALFGWITDEDPTLWRDRVERLYRLRCSYVHDGYSGEITGMDVFEADTLLKNLLLNLCKNTRHIASKQDIIKLTAQLEARRTLGLKPRRSGKITYLSTSLTPYTRKKINDIESWAW